MPNLSIFQLDVLVKDTSPTGVITSHRMDAKLKCASARQATKFPWKTSEVKVMDTKGPNYEDKWKSPDQKDAKLIFKKEQKKNICKLNSGGLKD